MWVVLPCAFKLRHIVLAHWSVALSFLFLLRPSSPCLLSADVKRENENLDLNEVCTLLKDFKFMPQWVSREAAAAIFKLSAAGDAQDAGAGADMGRLINADEFPDFLCRLGLFIFSAATVASDEEGAVGRPCSAAEKVYLLLSLLHRAALTTAGLGGGQLKPAASTTVAAVAPVPGDSATAPGALNVNFDTFLDMPIATSMVEVGEAATSLTAVEASAAARERAALAGLQSIAKTLQLLDTTVASIETHVKLREEERGGEIQAALESVYHHQHAADSQRLLRYREYARRILAARVRDRQQAVAQALLSLIAARQPPPREVPAWLSDTAEFSSYLKPLRGVYDAYVEAYRSHQRREQAIEHVEVEWKRHVLRGSDGGPGMNSLPMVVRREWSAFSACARVP